MDLRGDEEEKKLRNFLAQTQVMSTERAETTSRFCGRSELVVRDWLVTDESGMPSD